MPWLGPIRGRAVNLGRRLVERAARELDLDVIRRTPYSPIPKVPPMDDAIWETARCTPGLTIDSAAHLQYVKTVLAPYVAEFRPAVTQRTGEAFYLDNGYYGPGDAELLYAIVRHAKPHRILELGTGYSTLVTAQAAAMNAREGRPVDFVSIDPDPRVALSAIPAALVRLERRNATTVPLEQFISLEAGDVLFVDTSHTVKLGSEVNFVVLEVLPRLRSGVLVHFHDIFLPYEYPRAWFARGTYLAEQYLLHAFLIGNTMYEVVLAAHALARRHRHELEQIIPSIAAVDYGPGALWLRRR